jgi:hypothetical protein
MAMILALAMQAAAAPAPALPDIDFDLARYTLREPGQDGGACRRDDPNAIVVCARRGAGTFPLEEMARIFEPRRLIAETRLTGNLVGDVHAESVPMDRGAVSNRAMVRLRLPF